MAANKALSDGPAGKSTGSESSPSSGGIFTHYYWRRKPSRYDGGWPFSPGSDRGGTRGLRCQQPSYGGETIGTMVAIGRQATNWCQPQDSLGLPWWLHGK